MAEEKKLTLTEMLRLVDMVKDWKPLGSRVGYSGSVDGVSIKVHKHGGVLELSWEIVAHYDGVEIGKETYNKEIKPFYNKAKTIYQKKVEQSRTEGLNRARRFVELS